IEAQELTTAISQLAEQLETEDPEQRASALAELEAALLAEEGNKQAAIKEALKAGRHIEGAQLLTRRSWRIH
ncbi:MAG: hypothetical protein VKK63_01505, partial [Synechococcus sp.]|nr:hypothetical protein [Synechococcus sp.]